MAGGSDKTTGAATAGCHVGGFMVVVHSQRVRRGQVPVESALKFVAVGRSPVKEASVGNIWIVLAEVWVEVCVPGEGSQFSRISKIDHVYVDSAAVHSLLRFTNPETVPLNGTISPAFAG